MAWTWQTATFFLVIAGLLVGMTVWEFASPGGAPRHGALGLDTTRGDRLFISLGSGLSARTFGGLSASRSSTPSRCSDGCEAFGGMAGRPAGVWRKGGNS